jgi:hypothetical protein
MIVRFVVTAVERARIRTRGAFAGPQSITETPKYLIDFRQQLMVRCNKPFPSFDRALDPDQG